MGKPILAQIVVTALAILLLAFLMLKLEWGEKSLQLGVFAVYSLACLIGGVLAGKSAFKRKFLCGMEYGAIYFLLLCLLSLAAGNGAKADMAEVWKIFAVCVGSGMVGGMGALLLKG